MLDLAYFGLSDADLDTEFFTGSRTDAVPKRMKLREILAQLEYLYAGPIGAEFAHVSHSEERLWLQDQFQDGRIHHRFSAEEKRNILWQLTAAEGLERYLHTKYVGQKRFSLEGGDSLIPLLDDLIQSCGTAGVEEVVIGMAHRGRLNVLVNLLGKSPAALFSEFEGRYDLSHLKGSGDVKYHKGFSADLRTSARQRAHGARVQPVASGSRESGRRRLGARAPGAARRRAGRSRPAGAHPRRRGLRGPGRRDGDAAALAGARLLHRRHRPRRHQQPGRLHDLGSARYALDDLLQRRREDARGADLPRERGRSRGRGVRHRAWR